MLHDTPLRKLHEAHSRATPAPPESAGHRPGAATGRRVGGAEVEYVAYGPPEEGGGMICEIPATFGEVEAEYAVLRRGAGLLDCPHRGTIRIRGSDRAEFLNRMLTQELAGLSAGEARAAFWLNRQGRIQADLLVVELGDALLVDVDIHQAAETVRTLGAFVIADDVELTDVSATHHHVGVHGPAALELIAAAGDAGLDLSSSPHGAGRIVVGGVEVVVARRDQIGEAGLELIVPRPQAEVVWSGLLETRPRGEGRASRVRPVGWFAYNTARIEAGTPLFNVDFGTTNLPHETGILSDRVSFTKGCYLGQEIVARIESHGRPRQVLCGLRLQDDLLPVAGTPVLAAGGAITDEPIGVVTSSTLSPMLGSDAIAFAMMKEAAAGMGATVRVIAEGVEGAATIAPLRFWPPATS